MIENRKEYIVIKTYADGRQLIMAGNDWSSNSRQSTREVAGRLERRSMMNVNNRIKWQIPSRRQWRTITRMIAEKKINFDDLHCVLRGNSVWIEATNNDANVIRDGNLFQFMRGYAFTLFNDKEHPYRYAFDNHEIFDRDELALYFTKFTEQSQTW